MFEIIADERSHGAWPSASGIVRGKNGRPGETGDGSAFARTYFKTPTTRAAEGKSATSDTVTLNSAMTLHIRKVLEGFPDRVLTTYSHIRGIFSKDSQHNIRPLAYREEP